MSEAQPVVPFAVGVQVQVTEAHWNAYFRGAVGVVYSTIEGADGLPSCFVQFGGVGAFVAASDLRTPPDPAVTCTVGRRTFAASTVCELSTMVQLWIRSTGKGASELGARWKVHGHAYADALSYNGIAEAMAEQWGSVHSATPADGVLPL